MAREDGPVHQSGHWVYEEVWYNPRYSLRLYLLLLTLSLQAKILVAACLPRQDGLRGLDSGYAVQQKARGVLHGRGHGIQTLSLFGLSG